jgi:hypothetical protein
MSAAPWDRPSAEQAPWQQPTEAPPSAMNAPQMTPEDSGAAWKASVHARMIGVTPGYAYQNNDEIEAQLRNRDADYDKGFAYAAETGFEETPLGMLIRGKETDPFESSNVFERGVHNLVSFATDPVVMVPTVVGALADIAVPGAAIAGFVGGSALDAGLRKWMMENYEEGDTKSFGELADRAGDALWSATKGALGAEAFSVAGDIPVPGMIADKPLASIAMKGMYQASAMTLAGSLLDQRVPRLRDFEDSALMVVPLNLATGGLMLGKGESKQALMDVYAKDGTTPQESADKLAAQPPVKPDPAPGLKPAINFGESFAEADENESHSDLASRVLAQKPVEMAELEADPKLADKVLQNPEIHEQAVIDRAWTLKKEAIDSGETIGTAEGQQGQEGDTEAQQRGPQTIDQLYNRGEMKSGRGFVTPDGKFLDRNQAKRWVKDNEPEVHKMWSDIAGGDKEELHAEDYGQARERVNARTLAEGEPDYNSTSSFWQRILGAARKDLNEIKAGNVSTRYTKAVLRTLFVGQRDARIAVTTQLHDSLQKLIPDPVDQEALTFMRDFKDSPVALRSEIENIQAGTDEKMKRLLPAMERATNPTPQLLKADQSLTAYFSSTLKELQDLGLLEKGIPTDRYITHILKRVTEEGEEGRVGPFTKQRKYETVIDALKTGRSEARTVNALNALSLYGDRTARQVAFKLLTTELKNTELGKQATFEEHPVGWTEIKPYSSVWVPPNVADALRPIFENNALGTIPGIAKFLHVQAWTKGIELGLSTFHMKALTVTAFNNMGLSDFTRALTSDTTAPEFARSEQEWAVDGLRTAKTGTPYEAWESVKSDSLSKKNLMEWARTQPGLKQLDGVAQWLTHETFDVIQRKFKVMDASGKIAAWIAKHPQATDQEYFSARRSIAKEVNAAYGGLNWEVMGWGKNAVGLTRLFMLAPDWCVDSTTRAMTKTGWKYHHELNLGDEIMAFDPDSKTLKWSTMKDRYENHDYSGKMIQVKNYNRSILMTPDHKCYVRNFTKRKNEIVLAKHLQTNHLIPRCAEYPAPEDRTYSDMLVVLVGWIVTDGYVKKSRPDGLDGKEYRYGRIVQSKPTNVAMLKEMGLKWTVDSCTGNHDKFFANFQRYVFNIPKEYFDQMEFEGVSDGLNWEFLSKLTSEQRELLYDTMMLGDGTGQYRFCGKEREVFFMTMLQTLMGKPTTFVHDQPNCWRTRILADSEISCTGRKDALTEVDYEGTIWCPSVDTGFWLAEREGLVFITGNTFSNIMNLKYAGEGGPAGAAARMFWVKSFGTGLSMTAATSIMVGGKYDLKHPMQVYLGTDKDGKEMYANWFFAGAPKDLGTLTARVVKDGPLVGLAEFMAYKLGPVGSLLKGLATNKEFSGKPISKQIDSFGKKTVDQGEFAAQKLIPITGTNLAETYERMMKDPINEWTYKDYLEVAGDALGVTTVHESEKGTGAKGSVPSGAGRGGFHLPGVGRGNSGMRLPGQRR